MQAHKSPAAKGDSGFQAHMCQGCSRPLRVLCRRWWGGRRAPGLWRTSRSQHQRQKIGNGTKCTGHNREEYGQDTVSLATVTSRDRTGRTPPPNPRLQWQRQDRSKSRLWWENRNEWARSLESKKAGQGTERRKNGSMGVPRPENSLFYSVSAVTVDTHVRGLTYKHDRG